MTFSEEPFRSKNNDGRKSANDGDEKPTLGEAAMHGIVGDIVRTIAPHTESDPAAILLQTLVMAGSAIGPGPYYQVEGDRHHTNLFAVLVGTTSKARKGTSASRVRSILKLVDPKWEANKVQGGLSSGEGLINEVRDEVKKWNVKDKAHEITDPGVTDKRLLVIENEFAGALRACERHGNTLSPVLRNAWDSRTLSVMAKNSGQRATDPHVSIVGHITTDELRRAISRTDIANGFANRFLFAIVTRSKLLPEGGSLDPSAIVEMANKLAEAIKFACDVRRVTMTDAAKALWKKIYADLSEEKGGLLGAVTARAEAQVIRIALVYAVLDKRTQIDSSHLLAALAVWNYCEASSAYIFGDILGDPVADEILIALRNAAPNGMSRTEIRDLFGRNQSADRVSAALHLLASKGRAYSASPKSGERGRPTEMWFATPKPYDKNDINDKNTHPPSKDGYDKNDINDKNPATDEFCRLNRLSRNPSASREAADQSNALARQESALQSKAPRQDSTGGAGAPNGHGGSPPYAAIGPALPNAPCAFCGALGMGRHRYRREKPPIAEVVLHGACVADHHRLVLAGYDIGAIPSISPSEKAAVAKGAAS